MRKYLLVLILTLVLIALLVGGCAKTTSTPTSSAPATTTAIATSTTPKTTTATETITLGGTLTIIQGGPPTGNFGCTYEETNGGDLNTADPAIETLIRLDPKTQQAIPWLASAWKIEGNALTLTLEKGVTFSDGTPFNADAVKYCLDAYRNGTAPQLKSVTSIDVVDENTVRLNVSAWKSYSITCLAAAPGRISSPTAMKAHDNKWLYTNPIGTGPFVMTSWDGSIMKYDKNPNYWRKGEPYLDHIVIQYVTDQTTGMMDFQAGNAQIDLSIMTTADQRKSMEAQGYKFYNIAGAVLYMLPDSANPDSPWSKLAVRQAAAYAIDRAAIPPISTMYATVNQLSYPGFESYNSKVVGYPFDVTKAKQLLTDAGYSTGFSTTLYYPSYEANLYTALQSWLGAIGITVTLQQIDWGQIISMAHDGFNNGLHYYYIQTSPGADVAECFSSQLSPTGAMAPSTKVIDYPQTYLDNLAKAVNEPDATKRSALLQEMNRILIDDYCLMIPTYETLAPSVRSPKVHNAYIYEYSVTAWHPEETWLEK
jgi:peptide/nickel transport system substrate-binding protein